MEQHGSLYYKFRRYTLIPLFKCKIFAFFVEILSLEIILALYYKM